MRKIYKKFKNLLPAAAVGSGAGGSTNPSSGGLTNPVIGKLGDDIDKATSGATFAGYFISIWNAIIMLGALTVILYFIWGAFEWITSGGDSGKLSNARQKIIHSILGLLILVSSYTILAFLSKLMFGEDFNILNLNLPSPT